MRLNNLNFTALFCALVVGGCAMTHGFMTEVVSVGTNSSDSYANGIIQDDNGMVTGNWGLSTTVSDTDFLNDGLQGGPNGLQYVMLNEVGGSTDSNRVTFSVTPSFANYHSNITISQSPYHDLTTWNGGDADISRFYLTWNDTAGAISISDPSNQLGSVVDGQVISQSPQLIQFTNNRVFNSNDRWSIKLPPSAASAELEWSSSNPSAGSTLTREWVTFEADVQPAVAVPEPQSSIAMFFTSMAAICLIRRRKG